VDDGRDEPLIVPIRQSPPRTRVLLALVPVGAALWIAVEQSWEAIVIGGLLLVVSGWGIALGLAGRRARGSRPLEILVTDHELVTPVWRLAWDRVANVSIQSSAAGPALIIEPVRTSDIDFGGSRILACNAWLNNALRMRQISLPQRAFQQPLEDVLDQLEQKAARTFR
jgi:hypothetical protein